MNAQELRIGNWVGLNLKDFPHNYFHLLEVAQESMKVKQGSELHYFNEWSIEGIVFHHPDGRMCKLRKSDYGIKRIKN